MSLKLLVEFDVKESALEEYIAVLQGAKSVLLAEEGCDAVEVLLSTETPNRVILSEIWQSREIHDKYEQRMRESGATDAMADRLNAPPKMEFFEII